MRSYGPGTLVLRRWRSKSASVIILVLGDNDPWGRTSRTTLWANGGARGATYFPELMTSADRKMREKVYWDEVLWEPS